MNKKTLVFSKRCCVSYFNPISIRPERKRANCPPHLFPKITENFFPVGL